jgi:hypothetical protein
LTRALLLSASLFQLLTAGPDTPPVIAVAAGADLQAAIDRARPGDTLALEPGATYVGNFTLPSHDGDAFITIRTAVVSGLPGAGERIQPAHASQLAKLRSPNKQPVLATRPGAHHWRLELLEFLPTADGFGDIITLGDGSPAQNALALVPHALEIDRCFIHGDPANGQKRGIALNSGDTAITGSYVSDIKAVGQDAQAIAGWNGPGPYRIENNYLEAAGENFLLGGADPAVEGLVPEGLVFRRNHLAKPLAWRGQTWQVKNLFELKNARRALVEHNLMEHAWAQAQSGYAVLLTPRNQDGSAPWATVEDVIFRHNVVRRAGGGMQITGEETDRPSGSSRRITISDNLFYGIDGRAWGGAGVFLLIGEGPAQVVVERNTIDQTGNIVSAFGGTREVPVPIRGFVFRNNVVRHNAYGVHGADRAVGADTLAVFFPGAVFEGNVIAGGDPRRYPERNRFVSDEDFAARLRAALDASESATIAKATAR